GNRPPSLVVRRMVPERIPYGDSDETREMKTQAPLAIHGTEGMVVSYGRCCFPIPGDQITGVLNKGRGIVIHREGCRNIDTSKTQSDKFIEVQWASDAEGEFNCVIRLNVSNKPGVLARSATVISDEGANIENVEVEDRDGLSTSLAYHISVRDRNHLACIIRRLRKLPNVLSIQRV
ncbi:MAG: ACT domain-containing protein, partial [Gammaproteobacteria bacterium]